ncbi:MAG: hypothetical protein SF182_09510 [Deltaproteobacteria bacterium]|nr:hypothetical protein [Deltaproteobacteria bacterium]
MPVASGTPDSLGEPFPPHCAVLEVRLGTINQVFDAIDPAPFRERDLDPKAEAYIVEWAREIGLDRPLGVIVQLSRQAPTPDDAVVLQQAVREYFAQRALSTRRQLRQLLRVGHKSLLIGLGVLAVAMILGDLVSGLVGRYDYGEIIGHSLLIGGWVALWRPLEILLYDWWPVRAEAQLYDRLSAMPVRLAKAQAVDT